MSDPAHHFPTQQAVGSPHVRLASALAESLRLGLRPFEALACCNGNRVDEYSVIVLDLLGVTEHLTDLVVHRFGVRSVQI